MNALTKKEQAIAKACLEAGWPPPRFGPRYATIKIPLRKKKRKPPALSAKDFDAWCGSMSHAGVARFINAQLKTVFSIQDVWQMRNARKPISARIRQLVEDHSEPVDPKQ